MLRRFIMVLVAVAMTLGGLGAQGGAIVAMAKAADASAELPDCASMVDMKGGHKAVDCASTEHDDQDSSMKCPADNCTLRCGTFSAPTAASFVHYPLPTGLLELLPDFPGYVSAAGKPPLRPPRPSILA